MQTGRIRYWLPALIAFVLFSGPVPSNAFGSEDNRGFKFPDEEAVSLLSQYIQIDTTNPPGNETRAARFFKEIFDRQGIEARIIESAPGRGNIYARLKGDGSKKAVILLNHMDVVPADPKFWSQVPFSGVIKEGFIWGRGALDMKGPAILQLMTMLTLKRQGIRLKRDVVFLGTADEEAGGEMGAGFMVKKHFDLLVDAEYVLNEGGRIHLRDDGKVKYYGVGVAEKVPLWLGLTVSGTPGHGSMPRPDSAVNKLVTALNRVVNYQAPLKVVPEVQRFYADIARLEPLPQRERYKDLQTSLKDSAYASEFTKDPEANAVVRNTISVTMLEGSKKINVIPSEASAQIDARLLPGEDPGAFLSELRAVIADPSVKIVTLLSFPPASSPVDSELFKIISEIAGKHDPGAPVTTPLLRGFTDCHFFREKGISCYGLIPFRTTDKESSLIHGVDERVSLANVKFGLQMLYEIIQKLVSE